ncbi:hypothetical protein RSK60_160010 [Ralstonia solanacearum K60]|nr:hypothetical protein RSK60_160010 [Ralstonia solanacearum K60]
MLAHLLKSPPTTFILKTEAKIQHPPLTLFEPGERARHGVPQRIPFRTFVWPFRFGGN